MFSIRYQKFDNEMTMSSSEQASGGVPTSPTDSLDPSQLNFQQNGHVYAASDRNTSHQDVIQIDEIGVMKESNQSGEEGDTIGSPTDGEDDEQQQVWQRTTKFLEYDADEHELEVEMGFVDPSNPPIPGFNLYYMQWRTRRFVEHFVIRLLTALLIFVDMILLFVDLFNNPINNDPIEYCSLAFSTYFMIEVILRIFGLGPRVFFRAWHNVLDCFLVVFTFILSVVTVCVENMASNPASLIVALRLVRLVRITRILWERQHLQTGARQFVSQNKRRYQQNGFDLDLTYVTPRVIAMSFPSTGKMSMYRNDIKEVARFMDNQHSGHYRLYNLCSERHYDVTLFHNRVERFLIDDHNVPPLSDMVRFSANVREWMNKDEKNVIAVHCKGGKGRTGTMICVFLIDLGIFRDAEHCLGYFGDRRTDKNVASKFQGVETPSQSRYVGYYEHVVRAGGQLPPETPMVITRITLRGMHSVGAGDGSEFYFTVQSRGHTIPFQANIATQRNCKVIVEKINALVHIQLVNAPVVRGDTRIMFFTDSRKIPRGYEKSPFFFWFHTGFINSGRLDLNRLELDNPHKSKTWHVFQEDFGVTVELELDHMTKAY
ncbi:phosphatidylinositol 3,4,5-trisphosphate 3-phosphatase TPTE2-like isoform X1 [Homarus americanus]|uniref:phosphatidylinositol 3,4,5-trisphosphate 3-phosphatase TPTE2-like isoform X1 n=2 Tax=Homarus americanus TaxID=6706 RepID=UPI001C48B7C5|nr:phosphatidylinositol 3,4,5-trisphosphate 3-phosphatase TPTE2-like isoform X1 [Homarus americanus]